MEKYILHFNEIDKSSLSFVGGKGANLGEMTKAGFPVPQGFCVTTFAYRNFIETSNEMNSLFEKLEKVSPTELEQISLFGKQIREHIQTITMPDEIKSSILEALESHGTEKAYAVRSSATAEDLPTASFAGQQDTYLNIIGKDQLLRAVQNCWASLFTDRAISYRAKNGFNHRSVFLSVVVQEMVFPEVSGIMFTADPISGRRKTVSIDASYGLGEALVSGLVTADLYQVRFDEIVKKNISKKKIAIYSIPEGGTVTKDIPLEKQETQALSDEMILRLSSLGQKIETHYGLEQDIEWGLSKGKLYILQSRPITSLYPLPIVSDDKLHAFISFGHIQMMTDTMKPLSTSLFRNILNFLNKDCAPSDNSIIFEVGGRLFADFTGPLHVKPVRNRLIKTFKSMDELLSSAMLEVSKREDFRNNSISKPVVLRTFSKVAPIVIPVFTKVIRNLLFRSMENGRYEADHLIQELASKSEKEIFAAKSADRLRKIQSSIGTLAKDVLAKVVVYWITGLLAASSLEKNLKKKVGDKKSSYLLSQLNKSLPGNVTTELGLEIADIADTVRKYPEVIKYLERARRDDFYQELLMVQGGDVFKCELDNFLKKYGMRCASEIDISKPRWREDPTQLIPSILSNIRTASTGEHRQKYKQGEIEAKEAAKEILSYFKSFEKRRVARLIKLYRNLLGMREHHKFSVVIQIDIFKRAIMEEASRLVKAGVLKNEEDIFYFNFKQLIQLTENSFEGNVQEHIEAIKKKYEQYDKLTPPRVMTSEGEIITGRARDVKAPEGALIGTPVSAGIVEGIARVVLRLEDAKLNPGEILIAPYTDPGWTPLFTSAVGLITEVGGMMTHGSVVAREYGIPAVVGVDKATELIKDGALIRINGTEGFIEILN